MASENTAETVGVLEKKRGRGRPPKKLAEKKKGGVVGTQHFSQDELLFARYVAKGGKPADFFMDRGMALDDAALEAALILGKTQVLDLIDQLLSTLNSSSSIQKSALITYHWRRMLDARVPQASKDTSAKELKDLMGFGGDKNQGVKILLNVQLGQGRSIVTTVGGQKGSVIEAPENDDETKGIEDGTDAGNDEPGEPGK